MASFRRFVGIGRRDWPLSPSAVAQNFGSRNVAAGAFLDSARDPMKFVRWIAVAAMGALAVACGGAGDDSSGVSESDVFIAFSRDFHGFRDWQSFDVTKDAAPGTVHPDEMLIAYINKPPPTGSTSFPVGTIIIKEGTEGPVVGRRYFAMAKRGANGKTSWNASGAVGWDWFELENLASGEVGIVWRGEPPLGDTYGGDPNSSCNTCHVDCGNDSVCAPALQLSKF